MQGTAYPEEKKIPIKFSQNPFYTSQGRYLWIQPRAVYTKNIYSGSLHAFRDRICGGFQYIPQIAFYEKAKEVETGRWVNLIEVIKIIKGDTLKAVCGQIQNARENGDENLRRKLKENNLPYFTHAGVNIPRRNSGLMQPAFTYQLDIDKIKNADEILNAVIKDRQLNTLFASKSVSGNGVKALLFLRELAFLRDEWTFEQYRIAYHSTT